MPPNHQGRPWAASVEQMQENSNLTASVCLTVATDVEQEMQEKHSNKGKEGERISATQK